MMSVSRAEVKTQRDSPRRGCPSLGLTGTAGTFDPAPAAGSMAGEPTLLYHAGGASRSREERLAARARFSIERVRRGPGRTRRRA